MVPPRITAELFSIPHEGAFLVYAPLRRTAFLASGATVNQIADLQEGRGFDDECGAELIEFLRSLGIVDGGPEAAPITTYSGEPKPTTLTLFLTTSCNLRCKYCYASAGDTPRHAMPPEVAERGIEFVLRNALELGREQIEIIYHGGGEPTVNWQTLTGSYEYALRRTRECGLGLKAGMATNGVMSDAKIDWVIEHLDAVNLSFDGLPDVHDVNRLTVAGQGSSDLVLHTIERFEAADFGYTLRLTVVHDQIARLPESIEFICKRYHPRKIHVEPAFALGRWSDAPSAETTAFLEAFREAQRIARRYGFRLYFSAANLERSSNHFCGVTQDSFALTAAGNVSACYEVFLEGQPRAETFIYGSPDAAEGYRFNLPVLDNLRRQTVDRHEFCQGCFAKWNCGGDCYHKSLAANGAGEFAGSDRCHLVRELTKDQILERIEESGGLCWREEERAKPQAGRNAESLVESSSSVGSSV